MPIEPYIYEFCDKTYVSSNTCLCTTFTECTYMNRNFEYFVLHTAYIMCNVLQNLILIVEYTVLKCIA